MFGLKQLASNMRKSPNKRELGPIGMILGAEGLHLVQVEKGPDGFQVKAQASREYPKEWGDAKYCELIPTKHARLFLRQLLRSGSFHGKKVATCLKPNAVKIINLSYQVHGGQEHSEAIFNSMKEHSKDLDEYVLDFLPIRQSDERSSEHTALVALAKRPAVKAYLDFFYRAGLDLVAMDIGAGVLARLVRSLDLENQFPTVLLLNMANEKCYITVMAGRRLIMDRETDFGISRIARELAKTLTLGEDMALELLYKCGLSGTWRESNNKVESNDKAVEVARSIQQVLSSMFFEMASEINRVLAFAAAETRGSELKKVYLAGHAAHVFGMDDFLTRELSVPVAAMNPLENFGADCKEFSCDEIENNIELTLATGLALRGLAPI